MRFALYLLRSPATKLIWQEAPVSRCAPALSPIIKRYVSTTELQPSSSVPEETHDVGQDNTEGEGKRPERKRKPVPCPDNAKMMKISIVGLPNAGKSTIINALTKYNVCPVSKRPHTTRGNQQAVYLDEETQLVFVDTPGVVNVKEIKKFGFTEEFVYGPEKSIGSSDVVAVMHDVSNVTTREKLDFRIKSVLQKFPDKKAILILNKIDLIEKKQTLLEAIKYLTSGFVGGQPLPVITFAEKKKQSHLRLNTEDILTKAKKRFQEQAQEQIEDDPKLNIAKKFFTMDEIKNGVHEQGWPHFSDVFLVSALEEDGIELLRRFLILNAVPNKWLFDSETLTNLPPTKLALKLLNAKLLDHLPQEVPFKIVPSIEFWNENDSGELTILIKLRCPKERYKYRIIGTGGALIRRLTLETREALKDVMNQPIKLILSPVVDLTMANSEK